jgi:ribosomal protein L31
MAVSLKTTVFKDESNGNRVEVHSIKVNKSNRKGVKTLIGGTSIQDQADGSFYIPLLTKVNGVLKTIDVRSGDFVFRTGKNKRWQVLSTPEFNKRFSFIKG